MPGLPCSYGDVGRVELPLPLFLSEQPFHGFRDDDYTWESPNFLTLLVRKLQAETPVKLSENGTCAPDVDTNISIGGCPLECPFDPNENFEDALRVAEPEASFPGIEFSSALYEPMNIGPSRSLVRKIYQADEEVREKLHLNEPVGKFKPENPVYLAVNGGPRSKDLVMVGVNGDKYLELRMMGPYNKEAVELNVDIFLPYHEHIPNVKPSAISRQVHAVYEKIHGEFKAEGKVFIEFVWPDPKFLFEVPPAQSAKVKLAIQPTTGDANPFLGLFWHEISSLDCLMEIYHKLETSDLNRTHQSVSMADWLDGTTSDELKFLLNQQSAPNWDKGFDYSDSLETVLGRVSRLDRSDVDFTDRVWTILRKATCASELQECFHQLFTAVEAKLYRPYLFPGNTTLLGQMLKNILGNESRNFRATLTAGLALQMVIDCGISKLFKDYSFVLKTCRLAEIHELNVFGPKPRLFKESILNVKKLHCILEVLCLSKERLSLPMAQQEAQTRTLLQYFAKNNLDWKHTFHFDVPMSAVASVVVGMHPVYWNLKLESSGSLKAVSTNVIFSRDMFISYARKLFPTSGGTLPRGYYLYIHRAANRKV